ncbi:MerR family transcriptional regulator [Streptomyces sp. ATCC51928]|uniref:MerR family transcriptional regulator n=1 Tax=Streptomyces caviscabies TaxID=90079 RepID=A0ABW2MJD0_9ACTN|nr:MULTISPECIES: MerR family transcriptional regulator [unclassified Streptomyces]MDX3503413.1 MerR family transcriptional regulator [Streptomyces sp. ATCC51928]MDX5523772.1 MerR family transcriptional regulator [Streptomyces sp. DE06-01C]
MGAATTGPAFGLTVATLRFYEERGLVRHSERRGRVRYYRRADLARPAYAQLWHEDGLRTLAETSAIVDSDRLGDRLALIAGQRDALRERIGRLERAVGVLTHMLDCRTDRALECPMTGTYIRGRVDAALDGTPEPTGFWPEGFAGAAGDCAPAPARPADPARPARSVGDEQLLSLARGLVSDAAKVRERACETISDRVRSFDRREVRTPASLLASAAVLEQDADCLESELNALGELAVTGLFEAEDIAALRRLPRASVRPADAGHLDCLTAEYF